MLALCAATLVAVAFALPAQATSPTPHHLRGLIGGDTDAHGCHLSAGFTWCEASAKCLRVWEEACPTADEAGHFCAAGLVWCEDTGKCVRPWLCASRDVDLQGVSPPGGDLDAHGCKASAGYTWCAGEWFVQRQARQNDPPGTPTNETATPSIPHDPWSPTPPGHQTCTSPALVTHCLGPGW